MRRLTRGTIREARNVLTLTRARASGGGGTTVSIPQPTAQNEMLIASATPAWMLLAAPAAQGQVPITGADPYTPAWTVLFDATVPNTIEPDDVAAAGAVTIAARRDHEHAIVCAAPASPSVNLTSSAEGTGTSFARADHAHQLDQSIAPTWTALHTFSQGTPANQHAVSYRLMKLENDGPANLQIISETDSADVSALVLSKAPTTGDNRHWVVAHREDSGFSVGYRTSTGTFSAYGATEYLTISNTGYLKIRVADNTALAAEFEDTGNTEYWRIVSTDTQPAMVFNESGVDIDYRFEASGKANALFLQGSTGFIGVNTNAPTTWVEIKDVVTDYPCLCLTAGTNGELATPTGDTLRIGMWNAGTTTFTTKMTITDSGAFVTEGSAQTRLRGLRQVSIAIPDPEVGTYCQIYIGLACVVTGFYGNTIGGTSCAVNVEERSTPGSSGTNILTTDMVADSNGESVTSSFANSVLAAGNHLTVDVSAVTGTVSEVNITITVRLT